MPVFLFPGQGAQFSGMGMDLFAADENGSAGIRSLFEQASSLLGSDIRDILQSDAEALKRSDVSQIAITVVSLAAVRFLASRGIKPCACAGFSLGEYPALATAGVITETEALSLTISRGRIMQAVADAIASGGPSAVPGEPSRAPGMAAILGLSPEQVDSVVSTAGIPGLYPANYNSPLQTVVSGTADALDAAEAAFKAAGARRVIRLKVAGPFHSPLMAEAGRQFAGVLDAVPFRDPVLPVFSNVTGGRIISGSDAKKYAIDHISSPVRWTLEETALSALLRSEEGIPELVEAGPGKVLSGLWADSKLPGVCKPWGEL